jgi:hypothetical protein
VVQSTVIRYPKGMQFFDQNGKPLALGHLLYQVAGGSPLQDTWTDSAGVVPNANPVLLDGSGRTSQDIYLGSTSLSNYKETLTDSTGATVSPWPADNIPKATGTTGVSTDLSLTLRSGDADLNIVTGSGVNLSGATASLAGLMSAADKVKVNNLSGLYVAYASGVSVKNNAVTPNSKIDVATGNTIMTDTNGNGTWVASLSGTIDLSLSAQATGNCLDTGTFAQPQWYHVYQITNGTLVALLASLSATAPTLPAGYTKFIRLGAMRAGPGPALLSTYQQGNRTIYNAPPAIAANAAQQSISNFVPPTAKDFLATIDNNAAANTLCALSDSNNNAIVQITVGTGGGTDRKLVPVPIINGVFTFKLATGSNGPAVGTAYGWIDSLNVLS